jgi:hypothetical protein
MQNTSLIFEGGLFEIAKATSNYMNGTTPKPNWIGQWPGSDSSPGRVKFFGTANYNEADELLVHGWAEGAAKIAKIRQTCDPLVARAKSTVSNVAYDVVGQWLDIGKFCGGEPECWGGMVEREGTSARCIRIEANTSASCSVKSDLFFARGAAVCVLADIIESIGLRCEIWATSCSNDRPRELRSPAKPGETCQYATLLKRAADPLDMDSLAVALAHPSFFRRIGFNLKAVHGCDVNCTYPAPYKSENAAEDTIVIGELFGTSADWSVATIPEHVERLLASVGIKFEENVF